MSLGDVFYRRGAEGAEGGPGGAGPYRGLNARIPIGKNLCDLCVSAVKKVWIVEFLFYCRACFAEAMQAEGAEGGPGGAGPYRSNCGRSQSEFSLTLNLLNLIL
jgi:hypothetical protein